MTRETAEKTFLRIISFYNLKKEPTQDQIDLWYYKIKFIPEEAAPWILDQITNGDSLPRNIPKEMLILWGAWRRAHQQKTIAEPEKFCEDCSSHGTHLFKKLDYSYYPALWVSFIAMCDKCDNWQKHFGTTPKEGGEMLIKDSRGAWRPTGQILPKVWSTTKQEIIDKGFEYIDQHSSKEKNYKSDDPVAKVLEDRVAKGKEKRNAEALKAKELAIRARRNANAEDSR